MFMLVIDFIIYYI